MRPVAELEATGPAAGFRSNIRSPTVSSRLDAPVTPVVTDAHDADCGESRDRALPFPPRTCLAWALLGSSRAVRGRLPWVLACPRQAGSERFSSEDQTLTHSVPQSQPQPQPGGCSISLSG